MPGDSVSIDGQKVKKLRLGAGYNQHDLAHKAGVSIQVVQKAEQGKTISAHCLGWIAGALGVPPADLVADRMITEAGDSVQPGTNRFFGLAPPLPQMIVGREKAIAGLRDRLVKKAYGPTGFCVQVLTALRGWPGVGKTTLAAGFAHDDEVMEKYPDQLWTTLGQIDWSRRTQHLLDRLDAWGRACDVEGLGNYYSVEEARARLAARLRDRRVLIIVDDVWNPEDAQSLQVGGKHAATIITTRVTAVARALAPTADDVVLVECLSAEESMELLRLLAPDVVARHPEQCAQLVSRLEGLPLALQVAGRALNKEYQFSADVRTLLTHFLDPVGILPEVAPVGALGTAALETTPTIAALIHKSTDILPANLRHRFVALGSLSSEAGTFRVDYMARVWGVDGLEAGNILKELTERGLVSSAGKGRYHIHSLLLAHARASQLREESDE